METIKLSLGPLAWQIFNLVVLVAVFAFLGWRTVRAIRRVLTARRRNRP